jgi:hypothetical protein
MLTTGELYNDLGGDYFQRRDPRTRNPTTHQTTRSTRTPRHPPTNVNVNGRGGGRSLNVIFLSVGKDSSVAAAFNRETSLAL